MIKKILIILGVPAVILIVIFLSFDRIASHILAGKYDLDIKYRRCSKDLSGELTFNSLLVMSKRAGLGFTAKTAKIKPSFHNKHFMVAFDLQGVNFIKKAGDEAAHYDTLTALVSSPFSSSWKYKDIHGRVEPIVNGIKVTGLEAISDEVKLSINGSILNNGMIDSDIIIYFADSLIKKVPAELANTILAQQNSGWKSLSVRLSGDSAKPAIQVSSKRFRLTIKSASGT